MNTHAQIVLTEINRKIADLITLREGLEKMFVADPAPPAPPSPVADERLKHRKPRKPRSLTGSDGTNPAPASAAPAANGEIPENRLERSRRVRDIICKIKGEFTAKSLHFILENAGVPVASPYPSLYTLIKEGRVAKLDDGLYEVQPQS